ncbi:unnamed protein product, partial [Brenthis ino]
MQNESNSKPYNSKSIFNESTIVSENVYELTNIEFNSADDIRQRTKAVLTNIMPNSTEETQQTLKNNNIFKNNRQSKGIEIREGEQNNANNKFINKSKLNISRPIQTTELRLNKNAMSLSYFSNLLADRIISEIEFPIGSQVHRLSVMDGPQSLFRELHENDRYNTEQDFDVEIEQC